MSRGPIVAAAIDAGSNSVHLLVAIVGSHRLEPLIDESVFLGLGATVDRDGHLGPELRGQLVATLVRYGEIARRLGADRAVVLGTEPLRRAADAARAVDDAGRASGLAFHVLDHEEEGLLTLLGVTLGRPVAADLLVVDVGGGSSEFIIAGPGGAPHAAGLQIGSARLTARHVLNDPPGQDEIDAMRLEVRRVLAESPDALPRECVLVGGTASNLIRVVPAAVLDRVLTRRRLSQAMAELAGDPADVAAQRHLVHLARARVLPAGAVIVEGILDRYGLDRARVADQSLREGAVVALAHAGVGWRDRLRTLALGWRG